MLQLYQKHIHISLFLLFICFLLKDHATGLDLQKDI